MTKIKDEEIIKKLCTLFEIKSKKIDITSKISKYSELDSLNQLKLMGFIDENCKKKTNMSKIGKLKTFKDIIKLIND
jgi:acyl carrier protein|tara:strand:+ start:205 stop:435 length:231 start_codon:yes stop_codon:yes gene_type:complete